MAPAALAGEYALVQGKKKRRVERNTALPPFSHTRVLHATHPAATPPHTHTPTHTHHALISLRSELLKNLVLSGFTDLEVIDLDTIDVSNLNRQFLFRKKDVGAPKSLIAKDSVLRFNPSSGIQITSHLGNVKDPALFNADYVRGFSCVANACYG